MLLEIADWRLRIADSCVVLMDKNSLQAICNLKSAITESEIGDNLQSAIVNLQ